jgi:alpha-D-xyloside xylohydrolase
MFGDRLLVAPVFSASGETSYYIPAGTWTHLQTGAAVRGPVWVREVCDFQTVPIFVRPASVLPIGSRDDRPDYSYDDDITLRAYEFPDGGQTTVMVPGPTGAVAATFEVLRDGSTLTATRLEGTAPWRMLVIGQPEISVPADTDRCSIEM